jgi:hypothetical protein
VSSPGQPSGPRDDDDDEPFTIDTSVATPARVLDYLAGGDSNFESDRRLADSLGDTLPGGVDTARAAVRALSSFVTRAVRHLALEEGIGQFLNIGSAIPTARKIHEVAQQAAPSSRFVYVGDDPVVLAHAHSLRDSAPGGASAYVHGDVRDPEEIVRQAAETLDLTRPVAVMLVTTLNFVPDADDPAGIVGRLLRDLPPGSCLTIAHASHDFGAEGMIETAERLDEALSQTYVLRSRAEITRFFDGLDLVEPGLVQIDRWRPDSDRPVVPAGRPTPIYVAVGCTP